MQPGRLCNSQGGEKLEAALEVKKQKARHIWSTFWSSAAQKSIRRCGAKRTLKLKMQEQFSAGALLEAEPLEKCTPLWREARFEVKM